MFQTWFTTYLSIKLNPTDTTLTVATPPSITNWRLYLVNNLQEEWIAFSWVSWNTLTWLQRNLSKTADPITFTWTWQTWLEWTQVVIVAMHDQFLDKSAWSNTIWSDITYNWNVIYNKSVRIPVFADITARNTAIPTPTNWMECYITSLWKIQDYIAWVWTDRASAWADRLVAVSGTDTTPWALFNKTTWTNWIINTILNTWWNEILKSEIDLTYLNNNLNINNFPYWVSTPFIAWENINAWDFVRLWQTWNNYYSIIQNIRDSVSFSYSRIWQTFTTWAWVSTLKGISLYLQQYQNFTNSTIQLKLYASNRTTLIATATNTIAINTLPTSWYICKDFYFNNISLTPNTQYFFAISNITTPTDWVNVLYSSTNVYAWWNMYIDYFWSGDTSLSWDLLFWLYFSDSTETFNTFYKTDASNINKIVYAWVSKNTVTTWNTFNLITNWVVDIFWLLPWADYYLSNTPWLISTTPWTNSVKVWKAISPNWLFIKY